MSIETHDGGGDNYEGLTGGLRSAGGDDVESFSKRGSDLSKPQNKAINSQTKAASTYATKDLGAVERGGKAAETRKMNENARLDSAYNAGQKTGAVKGAIATAVVGTGAIAVAHALTHHASAASATAPAPRQAGTALRSASPTPGTGVATRGVTKQ